MALSVSITSNSDYSYYTSSPNDLGPYIEEMLYRYPQLSLSINFLRECLRKISYHTPSFRKTSARIVDTIIKLTSMQEKEIFGYLNKSVDSQIYLSQFVKILKEYSVDMKISYAKAPMYDGQIGSYAISLSEDSFNLLESVEKWNQMSSLVYNFSDNAPPNFSSLIPRIIYGIKIYQVV